MNAPPPPSSGPVLRAKTPGFAHHNVAFSPFFEDRLAVASGANFGLVGNGRLHVLQMGHGGLNVVKWYVRSPPFALCAWLTWNRFDTQDCVYDIAWNESHE